MLNWWIKGSFQFYYPPRDVFALNTGKYRPGCIFFVYTGAPVLWIMSVNNFRFFNNISESMQLTNIYNISLERCYCSASADVCCIKIHAEMTEILQVKDWSFYIQCCSCFSKPFSRPVIKYSNYLTHKSHKMVDNKSKTPPHQTYTEKIYHSWRLTI